MNIVFDTLIPLPRARRRDPATSKAAAAFATTGKAAEQRQAIVQCLREHGPQTMREVAQRIGLSFVEVSRRVSEIHTINRTGKVRDGRSEWQVYVPPPCYFVTEGDKDAEGLGA